MRRLVVGIVTAAVATGVAAAQASAADAIVRKAGGRVAGKITGTTKTELTIKPTTGDAVNVPANEIATIDWDDATGDLKVGLSDENGGRYEAALQRFNKSKTDSKNVSGPLAAEFEFLIARATAKMSLADPSKRDAAVGLLTAFQKTHADHFRYFESFSFLGQVQLAKQDYDGARQSFEKLAQAPWNDYKLAGKIAMGRIMMGENKLDEAAQAFDQAISSAGASPQEQSRKFEAMLGKARALAAQGKHAEALTSLEEVTSKVSTDETAVQAEAYVLQGNSLQALGRNKEAVLAYLHVDVLFPRETSFHAESLYHLSRLWKTVQLPERGADAQSKLETTYPNSEWTKKLAAAPAE